MKKINRLIVLGGCMMCFCIALFFAADTECCYAVDSTPPEVTSISIANANQLDAKGKAKVTITFIDSSAVGYVSLGFQNSEGHVRELAWQHDEDAPYFKDTFVYSFPLENAFANGEYRLIWLFIEDTNNNNATYNEEQINASGLATTIKIYNSTADLTPPVLNGFRILNTGDIDATGKISLEFDVTEEESGVEHLGVGFQNADGHDVQLGWDSSTGFKTGKKVINRTASLFGNGSYRVYFVYLMDKMGNAQYFYPEDQPEIFTNVEINVVNSTADTIAPVITDFALNTHEITTPDLVCFDLTFTDETYAYSVVLTFEDNNGRTVAMGLENGEGFRLKPGSYLNLQLPFGAFTRPGEYILTNIAIQDAMNSRDYNGEALEALVPSVEDRKLTINSAFDFVEDGSLLNIPSALESINNMSEGQTIVVDSRQVSVAPKSLFEAIAGQNKNIVFDDNDIQWVFNGLTVQPELCKDINVQTLIRTYSGISMGFPDDPSVVAVIFKNNGVLPGPAQIRINANYIKAKFAGQLLKPILSFAGNGLPEVEDDNVLIDKDNTAVTTIDHNSTYTLSANKPRLAALSSASLTKTKYTYTGKALKPGVTAVKAEKKAAAAKGYSVTYKNNKNVGKASVVIQGKGIYKGKLTKTFTINPKGTSLKTLKKKSKAIKVTWAKQAAKMSTSRITGYQILLATNSKFTKGKKTVNIKGYSKTSKTVKKLKGGKKYYVKIRTYKTVSGVKYYSGWSKVKTVKTKK